MISGHAPRFFLDARLIFVRGRWLLGDRDFRRAGQRGEAETRRLPSIPSHWSKYTAITAGESRQQCLLGGAGFLLPHFHHALIFLPLRYKSTPVDMPLLRFLIFPPCTLNRIAEYILLKSRLLSWRYLPSCFSATNDELEEK